MYNIKKVAYLGPEGTYSHITAQKHFGPGVKLIPLPSIIDVCNFASENANRRSLVPVENSSGGPIAETLDILIYNNCNLVIEESVRLRVKLALLGRKNEEIKKVYSHSVPLFHCRGWLRKKYPKAIKATVSSTAAAAKMASEEKYSAAIASINSADLYNLDVIVHPIQQEIPNQTQFYSLGLKSNIQLRGKIKTSIVAFVNNTPGSLYEMLEPFKKNKVNMSRIISRPIFGKPSEYAFYMDIDGAAEDPHIKNTVEKISRACKTCRIISSYPENKVFDI